MKWVRTDSANFGRVLHASWMSKAARVASAPPNEWPVAADSSAQQLCTRQHSCSSKTYRMAITTVLWSARSNVGDKTKLDCSKSRTAIGNLRMHTCHEHPHITILAFESRHELVDAVDHLVAQAAVPPGPQEALQQRTCDIVSCCLQRPSRSRYQQLAAEPSSRCARYANDQMQFCAGKHCNIHGDRK